MDYVRRTTESAKFMDKGAECISALGAFVLSRLGTVYLLMIR